MKKKIWILLLCAALLCSGCGRKEGDSGKNESGEPSASLDITESIPVAADGQEPYWAQAKQRGGKWYRNLNLDGIGEADDEAYVSMYQFGGEDGNMVLMLRVQLGTGETWAAMYPEFGYHDYKFKTGKLFAEDRDAIIIGVVNGRSNYNATNLWVLSVLPARPDFSFAPELAVRLDTTAWPDGKNLGIMQGNDSVRGLFDIYTRTKNTRMTRMPEVVDIEGSPLQGLKVTIFEPSTMGGGFNEVENVIYWKDGLWKDEDDVSYLGKWEFLGDWTPVSE